jgi:putative ABC transport system substrate-binding protein
MVLKNNFHRNFMVLSIFIVILVFSACGNSADKEVAGDAEEIIDEVEQEQNEAGQDTNSETSEVKESKKIGIFMDTGDQNWQKLMEDGALSTLKENGYDENSSEMKIIRISTPDEIDSAVSEMKDFNPDVAIGICEYFHEPLSKAMDGSEIPYVTPYVNAKELVDENGTAKGNITGLTNEPMQQVPIGARLIKKITDLDSNKKALFICSKNFSGFFPEDEVEKTIKESYGMEVSKYIGPEYFDEFETELQEYINDENIGLVILGYPHFVDKNTGGVRTLDVIKTVANSFDVPTVSFWDECVIYGILAAPAFDLSQWGVQYAELAVMSLEGKDIKDITAQKPSKINVVLNKATADKLNINFSSEVLGSAFRIFTDYEGNYVE